MNKNDKSKVAGAIGGTVGVAGSIIIVSI